MKTLHCPSRDDWQRFDRGLLDAQILAEFDSHLDECEHCAKLLEQLDENQDTLLAALRHESPQELAHDNELQELLNRAAREPFGGASTVSALGKGTDTDDPAMGRMPEAAPRRLPEIDGYRIIRILGQGGMGVVYEAVQLALNRRVAIKTIRAGELAQDEQVARFRQEANAAAALDHPYIVSVFEVGESGGLHFFSMAFVDGASLEQVARSKSLDAKTCASLVERLAQAMHYAHERGVVHRDLKPDNVMLDASGSPHITDFGLARRIEADDRLTSTGQVMGTVGYMSPEQAQGHREVGPLSDIYSLGAILYRLMADRPPFRGETPLDALREVIEREPVSPRLLNSKTPRDLETICLKCLEKSPARRYESAQALAAELARFLAGEPILARPIGPVSRAARWCRRKPLAAVAAVLTAIVVGLFAIGGPAVALRETRLRKHASDKELEARDEKGKAVEAGRLALLEKGKAVLQARVSEALRLSAESRAARNDYPIRSTLLALESSRMAEMAGDLAQARAENELRDCLGSIGGWPLSGDESNLCVAMSPTDRWLATGGFGSIRLWDIASTEPATAARSWLAHEEYVQYLAISQDGRWLASATAEGSDIRVWDLTGADPSSSDRSIPKQTGQMAWCGFCLAGNGLAVMNGIGEIRVWNLNSRELESVVLNTADFNRNVGGIAISQDGRYLAVGEWSDHGTVRVWDFEAPRTEPRTLRGARGAISKLAFSFDGRRLAASFFGTAMIWDLTAPDSDDLGKTLHGHDDNIHCLAFSPDGRWLATGSVDRTARLWALPISDQVRENRVLRGHQGQIDSLAISPCGRWLVTASSDRTVRIWNLSTSTPETRVRVLRGHESEIGHVCITSDSHWMATVDRKTGLRLWDLTAPEPVANPRALSASVGGISRLAMSKDGRWLAGGGAQGTALWDLHAPTAESRESRMKGGVADLKMSLPGTLLARSSVFESRFEIWDLTTNNPKPSPPVVSPAGPVNCLAIDEKGRWLAMGGAAGAIQIFDLHSHEPEAAPLLLGTHDGVVHRIAISSSGEWIVSSGGVFGGFGAPESRYSIRLWELKSSTRPCHSTVIAEAREPLAFCTNGRLLAFLDDEMRVRLADLGSPNPTAVIHTLPGQDQYRTGHLVISADDRKLAAVMEDLTIRVWALDSMGQVATPIILRGIDSHRGCSSLSISSDGRRLAAGTRDESMLLWDLTAPDPNATRQVLRGFEGPEVDAVFAPNGSKLITASGESFVRVWDCRMDRLRALALCVAGRTLTQRELETHAVIPSPLQVGSDASESLPPISIRDVLPNWPTDTAWHQRMVEECRVAGYEFGAKFHEERLNRLKAGQAEWNSE